MKDKYYPSSDFLQADKGRNPCYIWTSLLRGRQLLYQGLGWKLGNGKQINVWSHNWIPSQLYFKPFLNNSSDYPSLKVSDLIDRQSKTWNLRALQNHLHPVDIPRITKIQIPASLQNDEIIWMPDKHGKLFVQSTYIYIYIFVNMYRSMTLANPASSSHLKDMKKFGKLMWSNALPRRLSLWLWRAVKGKLLTKTNLLHKKLSV